MVKLVPALLGLVLPFWMTSASAAFERFAVGEPLRTFSLSALDGRTVDPGAPRAGGATVLIFWATWSPRSTDALGAVEALYQRYRTAGLRVVGINVDTEEWDPGKGAVVEAALDRSGVTYPVGIDRDLSVFHDYGVVAVPSLVVADGALRAALLIPGYSEEGRTALREQVAALLAAPDPDPRPAAPVASTAPVGARAAVLDRMRAVAADPGDRQAWQELETLLRALGRRQEAERVKAQLHLLAAGGGGLDRPLGPAGKAGYYLHLARFQLRRGMPQLALGALMRALAEDPACVATLQELGDTLHALGRNEEARRVADQLAFLSPAVRSP